MDSGLDGTVILVTGASGGIGAATARAMAAERARLVLHAFRHGDRARRLLEELPVDGRVVLGDLRDERVVREVFREAVDAFGRVDVLVANAGIWVETPAPVVDMPLDQFRDTIETDLVGTFLCCREYLRHLRDLPREEAAIVLVASTAAIFGEADHADYAAAKAAVAYGLTASLKNEIVRLAARGRVNCVCPGWTRTPLTEKHVHDTALLERVFTTMPLRKVATADDVAAAIVFLASSRLAGHLTGAVLPVAGGMEGRAVHA